MLLWVQLLVGLYVALAIVASVVSVRQLYRRQRPDAIFQFRSTLAYACQLLLRAFAAARFILVVVAQPLLYEYATWSFGLQGIYFVSATIYQVAHHWSRYEPVLFHRDSYVLNTLLDMSCASVLPALLAFATSTSVLDGQNLALHGASFLVYLLEFVGNHFVVQRQSLGLTLLLPTAYVILLCVHQESTPSTWLDLSSPEAAAGYACLFLSHVVAFGLFYMLSLLKESHLPRRCVTAAASAKRAVRIARHVCGPCCLSRVLLLYVVILVVEALGLGVTMLSYYTVWTFALQGVYLVWAIVHQLQRQRPSSRQSMYLHSLFDNCLAMSVLVLVVYWSLLYIPKMLWYSYIQHGGNTVLFGIELASTRRELQTHSIAFVLVFPTLYACFAWISVDSWLYRKWPYTFMDLDAPSAPLWYAGIMGGHVVIFGPVWGLSRLKRLAPTAPHSRIKTSNEV